MKEQAYGTGNDEFLVSREEATMRDKFMDRAEKLICDELVDTGLTVWRGRIAGVGHPSDMVLDRIAVGIFQNEPDQALTCLCVALHSSIIFIEDDTELDWVPFGGDWNPLDELAEFMARIKKDFPPTSK